MFPGATASALIAAFERLGFAAEGLRRSAGVLGDSVADQVFERLWAEVQRQTRSDALELDVVGELQAGAFGPFDLAAITAATVGDACRVVAENVTSLTGHGVELVIEALPGGSICLRILNATPVNAEVADVLILAVIVSRLREQTVPPLRPVSAQFTRAAPRRCERWEAFFAAPVRFGASTSALVFSAQTWRSPLRSANPAVHRALAPLLPPVGRDGFVESVRAHVRHHLGEPHSLGRVARRLGLSARTLQRRLAEGQTSLRAVISAVRVEEAERLLATGARTLAEVAALVGFSSATALSRALAGPAAREPGQGAERAVSRRRRKGSG